MNKVKWDSLKTFYLNNNADLSYIQEQSFYIVTALKGKLSFYSIIPISIPSNTKQDDFELNYKAIAVNFGDSNIQKVSLSGVGIVGDSLKVSGLASSSDSVNSKMRVDVDTVSKDLTNTYSPIYSYSGSGMLFSGNFIIDSDDIHIRLVVDSEVIFEVKMKDLDDIEDCGPFNIILDDEESQFGVVFGWPISYATSIEFQAKGNGDKIEKSIISLTKEV